MMEVEIRPYYIQQNALRDSLVNINGHLWLRVKLGFSDLREILDKVVIKSCMINETPPS